MMSIQETLRLFGITRCYKGFLHTAYAIQLAVENENRLEAVTKEIYMETARNLHGDRFPLQLYLDCGGTQYPHCRSEGMENQPRSAM